MVPLWRVLGQCRHEAGHSDQLVSSRGDANDAFVVHGVIGYTLGPELDRLRRCDGIVRRKRCRIAGKGFQAKLTQQSGIVQDGRADRDGSFGSGQLSCSWVVPAT